MLLHLRLQRSEAEIAGHPAHLLGRRESVPPSSGPEPAAARLAEARKAIIVNEQFWTPATKTADIVFPITTTLEREDIGLSAHERHAVAMGRVIDAVGEARNDFEVYCALSERLGTKLAFTEGKSEVQ
ncbi:molybdopterin-dependent oxidoreductase [Bradyrhizobium sp. CCGB12]|uniref:molybdopterin-dependent oxidoreductase n=1 Tax=Bradyrhizobium sp. CCGB12 TaxID=2949632 RepID=UPI0020B28467|nr:molybdopterin-dependent oxidoreductase [Bradyrhizobium sp. CCGB12]MCP3392248.1 molybdopterin-dependent oxidoreductase [Bradyrhizobium sp. CCGB12]